jgi:steroid 5-alpha reductase family enzyme
MPAFLIPLVTLTASITLFLSLWLVARRLNDPSFVDSFWAFGMVMNAGLVFWLAEDGWDPRKALLLALTTVWGLRLGRHLFTRWRREGPDPRYERLLRDARARRGWEFPRTTLLFVFLPQAGLMWLVSLPAQLGQLSPLPASFGPAALAGLALAVFGILFETVADRQLERFKAQRTRHDAVLDTGLWAWSRHPNYFGEACTWWGIWLVAAETPAGFASLVGPAFLTFTLLRWSGAPMLESGLSRTKPDYEAYKARTSAFFPWPPKRR